MAKLIETNVPEEITYTVELKHSEVLYLRALLGPLPGGDTSYEIYAAFDGAISPTQHPLWLPVQKRVERMTEAEAADNWKALVKFMREN
jgi:hypothetical protein